MHASEDGTFEGRRWLRWFTFMNCYLAKAGELNLARTIWGLRGADRRGGEGHRPARTIVTDAGSKSTFGSIHSHAEARREHFLGR